MGTVRGFDVWVVDGKIIRENVIPQFLYGGNHEEYGCMPAREIWIDHAISCEEYEYTLRHELCERDLMAGAKWTYAAAHDSALKVEEQLRLRDLRLAQDHERASPRVSPTDCYGTKGLPRLGDSVQLQNVYRVYVGRRGALDIWIVDGSALRRDIDPDFGLSGNDLAYHYIPAHEIWLDAQISCEEMEFSIRFEMDERALMALGVPYDDAYEKTLSLSRARRIVLSRAASSMPPIRVPAAPPRLKSNPAISVPAHH